MVQMRLVHVSCIIISFDQSNIIQPFHNIVQHCGRNAGAVRTKRRKNRSAQPTRKCRSGHIYPRQLSGLDVRTSCRLLPLPLPPPSWRSHTRRSVHGSCMQVASQLDHCEWHAGTRMTHRERNTAVRELHDETRGARMHALIMFVRSRSASPTHPLTIVLALFSISFFPFLPPTPSR